MAAASVVAMEVEFTRNVSEGDVKHLVWLQDELGDRVLDRIVITTGPQAYRREDGIAVIRSAIGRGQPPGL